MSQEAERYAPAGARKRPTVDDMHPGVECCQSCLDDAAYDPIYSLYPLCCCEAVRWGWESSYDPITRGMVAVPPQER